MSELTKNVKPLDDFNWEEFENGTVASVSKEELDKAYDETLNKVADHQVVDGKVISVDKKEVVVNIGYKSDGIIPASEFRYNPALKIGDTVKGCFRAVTHCAELIPVPVVILLSLHVLYDTLVGFLEQFFT